MEEKNNERKKILLVIAVFIALIAISVGGVYAYFSARATNSGAEITGKTLDINGTTLTIRADRVNLNPSPAPVSDDLLPAKFGVEPTAITTTEVNRALSKQCVVGGYTGCHVWKITATSTTDIPSANIKLNLSLSGVTDKDQWSYVVYTGGDTNSETILNKGYINTTFPNSGKTLDIHSGASLTAGTPAIYYVMIYLNNTNSVQNDGVTDNTTDERGTYNGTVILEAMGGEVYVNFYEEEATDASWFAYTIENNEVTIAGYRTGKTTYTVTDQSACESYFVNMGGTSEQATALCAGGALENGMTLGDAIAAEAIPSSDYETAGLSNVVITPAPTDVIIPSTIEGYPVTAIGSSAFANRGLTSVVIPSSVTIIGNSAFYNNQLTSVVIPSSVTTISGGAFEDNSLTSVVIPNSVTILESNAFLNAFDTTGDVTLNIDMETIPDSSFSSSGITNIALGSNVTHVGNKAFNGNSLTSIEIESENISFGNCAFGENPPLSEPFLSNYSCIPDSIIHEP